MRFLKETETVTGLVRDIFSIVSTNSNKILDVKEKSSKADIVSNIDIDVDSFITDKLRTAFPDDIIVTEEGSSELLPKVFNGERGWIIDPICGSTNVVRGIKLYTTNLILVDKSKVEASWVLDHSTKDIIWSVGENKVYINQKEADKLNDKVEGIWLIDIDNNGHLPKIDNEIRERFSRITKNLIMDNKVLLRGFNTSLSFAYVAIGKLQGSVTMGVKPWDILAACYLTEQNGGIVTNYDGTPWTLTSSKLILAGNKEIYDFLYAQIEANDLKNI